MPNYAVKLNQNYGDSHLNRRGWPCLAMLLVLLMAFTGFDRLVPDDSNRAQGGNARVGWYLRSGQWHADVRTLAAVFQYLLSPDPLTPTETNPSTNWVAGVGHKAAPVPSSI